MSSISDVDLNDSDALASLISRMRSPGLSFSVMSVLHAGYEMAVDGLTADPESLCDGLHGVFPTVIHLPGYLDLFGSHGWGTPAHSAPSPGSRQPCHRPLSNERAFELS